ncbi:MAG: TIGR03986 family CRISPR-associated RAMP protein, partial [Anaerolineae bacterium]|nr:TIGR03986 family CRISPR-associated RAMP protein [Anaerolineae bacterium]
MNPQHKNPTRKERTATAPYNFVPLPERPFTSAEGTSILNPDQSLYHGERLTGWIDVTLETKSPIYVRAPLTPRENQRREAEDNNPDDRTLHLNKMRNKPDFFYVSDPSAPVIPGSSLRGMIRNMVEILGHGKFGPSPERPLVYRAVGDTSSHGEAYRHQLMTEETGDKNAFTPKYIAGFIRKIGDTWYIQPAAEIHGITWARILHQDIPRAGL